MEKILLYLHVIVLRIYSRFQKMRLAKLGKGSVFHPGATLYNPRLISIGDFTVIRENIWLNAARGGGRDPVLRIGNRCYIGRFCQINAKSSVILEDKVLIADRVYISDYDHDFSEIDKPIIDQGTRSKGPVLLKYGCWIGAGSVILSGVTIGKNAVVGANSMVNRDVPDNAIAVGTPAKIVRIRD